MVFIEILLHTNIDVYVIISSYNKKYEEITNIVIILFKVFAIQKNLCFILINLNNQ